MSEWKSSVQITQCDLRNILQSLNDHSLFVLITALFRHQQRLVFFHLFRRPYRHRNKLIFISANMSIRLLAPLDGTSTRAAAVLDVLRTLLEKNYRRQMEKSKKPKTPSNCNGTSTLLNNHSFCLAWDRFIWIGNQYCSCVLSTNLDNFDILIWRSWLKITTYGGNMENIWNGNITYKTLNAHENPVLSIFYSYKLSIPFVLSGIRRWKHDKMRSKSWSPGACSTPMLVAN